MPVAKIILSPGLFGFNQIGAYAYFRHLEKGLMQPLADARLRGSGPPRRGVADGVDSPSRGQPRIAEMARTAQPSDRIHLVGHSTGGLDARLVACKTSIARRSAPRRRCAAGSRR